MFAKDILTQKGPEVVSVSPETAVDTTASLFRDQHIGFAIVVNAEGTMIGTVSERDIMHGIASFGAAAANMRVKELMTRNIVTCTPDDTLQTVMRLMTDQHTRHVLVMTTKGLAGVVSIGDALKQQLNETEVAAETMRDYIGGKTYN